ncbi:NADPH:quinone oxidoreductase family protein [uncultured Jatrophihabitans sp.]|uniref:NADPH:quinone oxidoreductase family protein n=1 Tax=uncultured Jatrophihabitans sp. TaxID=1610747 RepID=UPI0035C985A0
MFGQRAVGGGAAVTGMLRWYADAVGEPANVLALRTVDVPEPGPGQLLVKVAGAALGFPDVLLCRGAYQVPQQVPFTPGAEVAGIVVGGDTSGRAATGVGLGTRVAAVLPGGVGALAQFAVVDRDSAFPVPAALNDAQAAALTSAYTTAWFGLHERGHLAARETLVVTAAAGGVGSAAVQLGLAAGARVIGVVRGAHKVQVARGLGAHLVIDSTRGTVSERVLVETGGRGADVVFDPVGGDTYVDAQRYLAFGARYLVVGFAAGAIATARLNRPLLGSWSIVGVNVGLHVQREPDHVRAALERIGEMCAAGVVRPLVGDVVPMARAATRLQDVGNGATTGRIVVDPWH